MRSDGKKPAAMCSVAENGELFPSQEKTPSGTATRGIRGRQPADEKRAARDDEMGYRMDLVEYLEHITTVIGRQGANKRANDFFPEITWPVQHPASRAF